MKDYYFLGAFLPSLQWGETPAITFAEMSLLLEENLSPCDLQEFKQFRLLFDLENIRALWMKQPLDPAGALKERELEEALNQESHFPLYVFDFLNAQDSLAARLHSFPELISLYFQTEILKASDFFKKYLQFERDLRLVLLALRAKHLKRNLLIELQYEDPEEDFLAEILAQKDAKDYMPPEDYLSLKEMYEKNSNTPLRFFESLCHYRFDWVEKTIKGSPFSWERVFGEVIKLMLIERWNRLDQEKGVHLLREAL